MGGQTHKIMYKRNQIVNGKLILEELISLGKIRYYKTKCLQCGNITTIREDHFRKIKSDMCKKCYLKISKKHLSLFRKTK